MVTKLIEPPPGVYTILANASHDKASTADGFVITIVPVLPTTLAPIFSNIILLGALTAVTL